MPVAEAPATAAEAAVVVLVDILALVAMDLPAPDLHVQDCQDQAVVVQLAVLPEVLVVAVVVVE
jgi:hypothetical protein